MARTDLAQIGTPKLPVRKQSGKRVDGEGEEETNHSSLGHLARKENIDTENITSLNLHGKCHILFKIFHVTKHSSHPKEIEKISTFSFSQVGVLIFTVLCVCDYCFQHFWVFFMFFVQKSFFLKKVFFF